MDDEPETVSVARRTMNNVLGAENDSYPRTLRVELEADRLYSSTSTNTW